jgi:hypothetical protein
MLPKSESTKNTSKATSEDESSLDCKASFSFKLKRVEPKLPFYLILAYMLLAALFGENHLLLPLREAFLFLFGE